MERRRERKHILKGANHMSKKERFELYKIKRGVK